MPHEHAMTAASAISGGRCSARIVFTLAGSAKSSLAFPTPWPLGRISAPVGCRRRYTGPLSNGGGSQMKRMLLVVFGVLAFSASALAQGGRGAPPPPQPLEPGASQAEVDKAVLPAPENQR